ncbi:MAG TPA: MFS transporter, partial [Verrucomicrobiae bacterium]|nr:MFS transporter [Verrucomicrobiae bacterium]
MRAFALVWVGQIVSLVGSGLTAFSLGVWIFLRSDSTTQYALVIFCAAVPPLVVLPLAGPLIDRWDRKRLLIACDLAGAAATAAVGFLAWSGTLSLIHACVIVAFTSSAAAFQFPAYSAVVTQIVPRGQLGRASGMTSLAQASSQIIAPVVAGALVVSIGLAGITALDFVSFLFSALMLSLAAIPRRPGGTTAPAGYWRDLPFGWSYIFSRSGLAALLLMFAVVNFFAELASVLFTPLVLGIASPAALGTLLSLGGVGMIAGSAIMSVWGGPRRPALGAALFAGASGVAVA